MAENSKIEWCDHTFNPWIGCTKVCPGCDRCYAEAMMDTRLGSVKWGAGQERKRTSATNWRLPIKWNAEAERSGTRPRVFCASLADVFDNEVPAQWRVDLLRLIRATPSLDWLLLTKRIGNAEAMLDEALFVVDHGMTHGRTRWGEAPWANVWIGATICNQTEADRDIIKLLDVPARVHFVSVEPMLELIDLTRLRPPVFDKRGVDLPRVVYNALRGHRLGPPDVGLVKLDWVICGGESGPHARPMHPDWVRALRDQCAAARVPFLFKQWGEFAPLRSGVNGVQFMQRVGKKAAGRLLDGREHNEFPVVTYGA